MKKYQMLLPAARTNKLGSVGFPACANGFLDRSIVLIG
jgi:hypothetical protein